ncbi:hypothetical protein E5288_WYG018256 [Bos mutus]|uniref:Uncharacterized protein n=1 Tax=Bos mutus TaxID=72004 RepID=A0A6B0S609_9CETA|nr:hypothetical protein [Bos mutus]
MAVGSLVDPRPARREASPQTTQEAVPGPASPASTPNPEPQAHPDGGRPGAVLPRQAPRHSCPRVCSNLRHSSWSHVGTAPPPPATHTEHVCRKREKLEETERDACVSLVSSRLINVGSERETRKKILQSIDNASLLVRGWPPVFWTSVALTMPPRPRTLANAGQAPDVGGLSQAVVPRRVLERPSILHLQRQKARGWDPSKPSRSVGSPKAKWTERSTGKGPLADQQQLGLQSAGHKLSNEQGEMHTDWKGGENFITENGGTIDRGCRNIGNRE